MVHNTNLIIWYANNTKQQSLNNEKRIDSEESKEGPNMYQLCHDCVSNAYPDDYITKDGMKTKDNTEDCFDSLGLWLLVVEYKFYQIL